VAPQVHTASGSTFVAGTAHVIQADFSDPGALDAPWSYVVSWGDGSKNAGGTMTSAGALDAAHTYKQAGSFRIRVTVTDKDGGVGAGEYTVTVGKKGNR
jgi:hypothetical protein